MVKIIVDSREKAPMEIAQRFGGDIEIRTLQVGDYACSLGCCGFERKEDDFSNMQRTLSQIEELKSVYKNAYLFVNKSLDKFVRSKRGGNKYAKEGYISSLIHRNMIPVAIEDHLLMFNIIRRVIMKNHDGKSRGYNDFNHVRHVTVKDQRLNILTSLPGIGRDKAEMILKKFGSIYNFMLAEEGEMQSLPGFGPKTTQKIFEVLQKDY
jgi:ERCC4-type nuclease